MRYALALLLFFSPVVAEAQTQSCSYSAYMCEAMASTNYVGQAHTFTGISVVDQYAPVDLVKQYSVGNLMTNFTGIQQGSDIYNAAGSALSVINNLMGNKLMSLVGSATGAESLVSGQLGLLCSPPLTFSIPNGFLSTSIWGGICSGASSTPIPALNQYNSMINTPQQSLFK